MVVNTFVRHYHDQVSDQLPDLQDQKLLTLCWRSFSESGRERVASCVADKDSLSVIYECL
jgi:hypothetical protein